MVWLATADQRVTAESGITRYLEEIRRVPMLEPHEEHMLAKRWREHGDHEAAHKLVNSHLRLVARIATGYRGYSLPISELISEGNVGPMQAVKRFEPDKGFRLATCARWWIKAAIQEFRSNARFVFGLELNSKIQTSVGNFKPRGRGLKKSIFLGGQAETIKCKRRLTACIRTAM